MATGKEEWRQPRKCVICGKEFIPNLPARVTCSNECAGKRNRETARLRYYNRLSERRCKKCGAVFHSNSRRIYCSDACRFPEKYRMEDGMGKKAQEGVPPPGKRFLKRGIIPPTEGWDSRVIKIGELPPGGRARLKCDPKKLRKPLIEPSIFQGESKTPSAAPGQCITGDSYFWTEAQDETLREMRAEGKTFEEIAEQLGKTKDAVIKHAKLYVKYKPKKEGKPWDT